MKDITAVSRNIKITSRFFIELTLTSALIPLYDLSSALTAKDYPSAVFSFSEFAQLIDTNSSGDNNTIFTLWNVKLFIMLYMYSYMSDSQDCCSNQEPYNPAIYAEQEKRNDRQCCPRKRNAQETAIKIW